MNIEQLKRELQNIHLSEYERLVIRVRILELQLDDLTSNTSTKQYKPTKDKETR